jgi:L-seryl-tRNA(Ser) seleniumtransferase
LIPRFLCDTNYEEMRELLRKIPKVDEILGHAEWKVLVGSYPEGLAKDELRCSLDQIRSAIKEGALQSVPSIAHIIAQTGERLAASTSPRLKRVINGTGVIIHTNLGRSLLARAAAKGIMNAAVYYTNLEYSLETGQRGDRYEHCNAVLKKLTSAEDALVVNNNAAAVYLILNTLAEGREAIISRGELVEIGGSFRIPDVMKKSGVALREVGTTNRTYKEDYERAIGENTALLMKIHPSNFKIKGFTHSPTSEEIVELGRRYKIPSFFDAGSGLLFSLEEIGALDEPSIPQEIERGFDLVCFSGDKLLGAPQAGIIVGKKVYVDAMRENPLTRALRPDKLTLAGLENTLLLYLDKEKAKREIPTLRMIFQTKENLRKEAKHLMKLLRIRCREIAISGVDLDSEVGGGTLPDITLPSFGIALKPEKMATAEFDQRLRHLDPPIIGRIEKDTLLIDMRTLHPEDEAFMVTGIETVLKNG